MSWLLWYGLRLGLDYFTAQNLPLGELIELVNIHRVKTEGAALQGAVSHEEAIPKDLR